MRFRDRQEAGLRLAAALEVYRKEAPVVVGLTRGGVPVASEVARALGAPLDALVVRKLGAPMQPELALGAITEAGGRWIDDGLVAHTRTPPEALHAVETRERIVLEERIARCRAVRPREPLAGRTVIVVDDGIATGATVRAALWALRRERPAKLVLAVPVAAASSLRGLSHLADEVVCLAPIDDLFAVGVWYEDFAATSDATVLFLLRSGAPKATDATV